MLKVVFEMPYLPLFFNMKKNDGLGSFQVLILFFFFFLVSAFVCGSLKDNGETM